VGLKVYITWMMSIFVTILAIPEWQELIKIYIISVVVLVTVVVNLLFQIQRLRIYVVDLLVSEALSKFFEDADVRKAIDQIRSKGKGRGKGIAN
jgi:hypothetical protein